MAPTGSCERKKSFAGNLSNRQRDTYMIQYLSAWCALKADRRAVTALEYALIAGVIVATILVGFNVLATDMSTKFNSIGTSL